MDTPGEHDPLAARRRSQRTHDTIVLGFVCLLTALACILTILIGSQRL